MTKDELAAIEARVKKVQRDAYIEESEEELWIIVQEDIPALAAEVRRLQRDVVLANEAYHRVHDRVRGGG